jgi:membrane protein DedA with SNARE-associated domain
LPVTLAIAFVGGTLGDQIFFWLGRVSGSPLLDRIPHSERRVRRVKEMLQRHHAPVIVGIRFMYGLRIIGPIVLGACEIPPWRFAFFNMLGAAIWALLVGGFGYLLGDAFELLKVDLRQFEAVVVALIVAVAVAFALIRRWRSHAPD